MAMKNLARLLPAIALFIAATHFASAQTPAPGVMAPRAYLPWVENPAPPTWQTTCVKAGKPFTDVVYIGQDQYLSQQTGQIYKNCIPWSLVPVRADGEAGLNALATDGTRLWASYANARGILTLAEIYADGSVAPIATFGPAGLEHNSAALFYSAPDLLVALGDNDSEWTAQSSTLPNGKLWAFGPSGVRVVAKGFRNPWQISRLNDGVYISDVGNQRREEASVLPPLIPGAILNYGWPCFEATYPNAYDPETCDALVPGVGSEPPALEYGRELGRGIVGTALINGQKVYADFTGVIRTWKHAEVYRTAGFISKMTPTARGVAVLTFSPDAGLSAEAAGTIAKLEEYKP